MNTTIISMTLILFGCLHSSFKWWDWMMPFIWGLYDYAHISFMAMVWSKIASLSVVLFYVVIRHTMALLLLLTWWGIKNDAITHIQRMSFRTYKAITWLTQASSINVAPSATYPQCYLLPCYTHCEMLTTTIWPSDKAELQCSTIPSGPINSLPHYSLSLTQHKLLSRSTVPPS
jgi:hypothetical protein